MINSVWNQKRDEDSKSHQEETAPLREAMDKYAPLLKDCEPGAAMAAAWAGCARVCSRPSSKNLRRGLRR